VSVRPRLPLDPTGRMGWLLVVADPLLSPFLPAVREGGAVLTYSVQRVLQMCKGCAYNAFVVRYLVKHSHHLLVLSPRLLSVVSFSLLCVERYV